MSDKFPSRLWEGLEEGMSTLLDLCTSPLQPFPRPLPQAGGEA